VNPVSALLRAVCTTPDYERREKGQARLCLAETVLTVSHGLPRGRLCLLPLGHEGRHDGERDFK